MVDTKAGKSSVTAPLPPMALANRVGALRGPEPLAVYQRLGAESKAQILSLLPADWSFEGKHVLDFGCGAGRTLRHFLEEARVGEFWGCDIDEPSVAWLQANLCPPLHAFVNGSAPPLPHDDGTFDLIWAVSVFTHITDQWAPWMLELHRVLADGGILVVSFLGEGMSQAVAGESWDENRIGMNVLTPAQPWEAGGPIVLHSPWWIRAHWGRLFEVLDLRGCGFVPQDLAHDGDDQGHGIVVLGRREVSLTVADLEISETDESRELAALRHNVEQLGRETAGLRDEIAALETLSSVAGLDLVKSVGRRLASSAVYRLGRCRDALFPKR